MSEKVTIEHNGKEYSGTYTVSKNIITVSNMDGHKATQLGGSPPEALAKILLREIASAS